MGLAPSDVKGRRDSRLRKGRLSSISGVSPACLRPVSGETRQCAAVDPNVNRNRPLPYPEIPGASSSRLRTGS